MTAASQQVVIITGFLGAGKTTVLQSIMSQLPATARPVWLKNEFGDVAVDSRLSSGAVAVREIVDGCLCCQLVGQMADALTELAAMQPPPDYIFVETSGSAYPGPVAREVQRLQEEGVPLRLASIICVVDCENFPGYKDTSYTARLQAKYTDLILLNKHENVTQHALDVVIDQVVELNPDTARLETDHGNVDVNLVLEVTHNSLMFTEQFCEMIETGHHAAEVNVLMMKKDRESSLSRSVFEAFLQSLPRDTFYRVKGFIWFDEQLYLLNFAFGRYKLIEVDASISPDCTKLTFMGAGIQYRSNMLRVSLQLKEDELRLLQ